MSSILTCIAKVILLGRGENWELALQAVFPGLLSLWAGWEQLGDAVVLQLSVTPSPQGRERQAPMTKAPGGPLPTTTPNKQHLPVL